MTRRRLKILSLVVLAGLLLLAAFASLQWSRFDLNDAQTLKVYSTNTWQPHRFKTQWSATQVSGTFHDATWQADAVHLHLNPAALALGQIVIDKLTITNPVIETSKFDTHSVIPPLHAFLSINAKEISIANGLIIVDAIEVHNLTASLVRASVLGEYATQLSADVFADDQSWAVSASSLVGAAREQSLSFDRSQWQLSFENPTWRSELAGKARRFWIQHNTEWELEYFSFSSAWQFTAESALPNFDVAGGITKAIASEAGVQLDTLDAALAYRAESGTGVTLALQSNNGVWAQGLTGQLGLSLLLSNPSDQQTTETQLALSGGVTADQGLTNWTTPQLVLNQTSNTGELRQHRFTQTALEWQSPNLILRDGDWQYFVGNQPAGDYGFGELAIEWPSLLLSPNVPALAALQQPLTDVSNEVVELHALLNRLVP